MNQNLGLRQKVIQNLTISHKVILSLKIARYSTPDLANHIQHEISENPFLIEELEELKDTNTLRLNEIKTSEFDHQIENEYHSLEKYHKREKNNLNKLKDFDRSTIIEETIADTEHLSDVLIKQLRFYYLENEKRYRIGEGIIGSLDEDGYLKKKIIPNLIKELAENKRQFNQVLSTIKTFEPAGIASGDIQECLLTQIKNINENEEHQLEHTIIKNHFSLLAKKKYFEIAKLLNIPLEEVKTAAHHISLLEPKPGRKYHPLNNIEIVPDVRVENINGQLKLSWNNSYLPKIKFNDEYKNLLKIKNNLKLTQYLSEKEQKARFLLESIEYRKSNLLKVMENIIVFQKDFFFHGIKSLKPYTLLQLTEKVNINHSTLSRIINSKYIETEWGTFNLSIFFSSFISSRDGKVSSNKIKELIKEIIADYDDEKKLSDRKITEVLNKKGYNISRRTVTKYREKLEIPSSVYR